MDKKLRILFISNLYPPYHIGGYEIACRDIAEGFKRNGHIVRILTSTHGIDQPSKGNAISRLLDIELKLNAPQSVLQKSKILFFNPRNYKITREYLEEFRPDIVSFWSINGISAATIYAAKKAQVARVFHLFDRSLSYLRKSKGKAMFNLVLFYRLGINYLISSSTELRKDYIERGFPADSIRVIPHGIDLNKFSYKTKKFNGILRLLFVGQLWEAKGLPILLIAISRLREKGVPVKLSIVGSGERNYIKYLLDFSSSLRISDDVEFLGRIERAELIKIYHKNHLLVFPSIWKEPFGIVLLEAMASGTPVVASRIGGSLDIVEDNKTGYFFDPGNVEDMTEKILKFADNPGLLDLMGRMGRKRIERKFDLKNVLEKMTKIYIGVLKEKNIYENHSDL